MAEDDSTKRTIWIVIAVLLAGILVAAAILVTQCTGDDTGDSDEQGDPDTSAEATGTDSSPDADAEDGDAPAHAGDEPADPAPASPWDADTGEFDGRITEIRMEGGAYVIVIDYVQMMSTEEAIAAGHESVANADEPPDFRIVNESERYRTWPVAAGALAFDEHPEYESGYWDDFQAAGGTPETPVAMGFDEFATALWTPYDSYHGAIHRIELMDGEVQSVRHLFFP